MKRFTILTVLAIVAVALVGGSAQAALLGVGTSLSLPDVTSNSTGTYSYDPTTNLFTSQATPLSISFDGVTPTPVTGVRSYSVSFYVDEAGNFAGGIAGNDLEIYGDVDEDGDSVVDYSGLLISGNVNAFGWLDIGQGVQSDLFDFTFDITGGALAGFYNPDVGGGDFMTAEQSNFVGDFLVPSSGNKVKHDTTPLIPEPTTMVLFGTGLLGLARRKFLA